MKRVAMVVAALLFPVLAWSAPLQDPEPVIVPTGLSEADVASAIRNALMSRRFMLQKEDRGVIDASFRPRTHVANIRISYDTHAVKIRYVSSTNLDYEVYDGVPHIHKNYNRWMRNLAQDISVFMAGMKPGTGSAPAEPSAEPAAPEPAAAPAPAPAE